LCIVARFFDRSKRCLTAYDHPDYRQLGQQSNQITALAVNVLVERLGPRLRLRGSG
jgi:hypothetical protein